MPLEKPLNKSGSEHRAKVIAVGGAKGGIGKSLFVTNFGVFLSQLGKKVVLVDLDLERDLVVEYQGLRNEIWRERILPLLRAEMAKVRARAGSPG